VLNIKVPSFKCGLLLNNKSNATYLQNVPFHKTLGLQNEMSQQIQGMAKGKMVKLSLCLTKHHVIKTYWGMDVQLHTFSTSAIDGGE